MCQMFRWSRRLEDKLRNLFIFDKTIFYFLIIFKKIVEF